LPKHTRTKIEREADLDRIAELYLQRYKQAEIAEILGVTQQQISYDLKKIQKRWSESALRSFDQAKAEELAKIDELERVYFDAWRRSQGEIEIKSVDRERVVLDSENKMYKGVEALSIPLVDEDGITVGKEGEIVRTSRRTEYRVGEKAFLSGVEWCIQQRIKIFGIAAPTKIAPTDPTGEKEYGSELSDEGTINRVVALFDAARARRAASPTSENNPSDLGSPGGSTNSSS
jgi:predicted transcriptional regulator